MSIVDIAWRAHPDFPLVLLYNRDEAHERASAPAENRRVILAAAVRAEVGRGALRPRESGIRTETRFGRSPR